MNQQFTVIVDYSPKNNDEILDIAYVLGVRRVVSMVRLAAIKKVLK